MITAVILAVKQTMTEFPDDWSVIECTLQYVRELPDQIDTNAPY